MTTDNTTPYAWSHPDTNSAYSAGHGYRNTARRVSGQVRPGALEARSAAELMARIAPDELWPVIARAFIQPAERARRDLARFTEARNQ
jgi:hypothetical protein